MEKGLFLVLRLRDGVLKGGMAGGCVGYRCVRGRQNSAGRGNWKRELYIYIYIYIYILFFFPFFFSRKTRCLFCLHCTMLQAFFFFPSKKT